MDREEVLVWLAGQIEKLGACGGDGSVQQKQIDLFVTKGCKRIERICKGLTIRYADVVWGGLAVLISRGAISESFGRKRRGGLLLAEWKHAAIVAGGWHTGSVRKWSMNSFVQWKAEVLAAVMRVPGVGLDSGAVIVPAGGLSNAFHRVKRMWQRSDRADMFHFCVAMLAVEGKVLGDVSRRRPGGVVSEAWWRGKIEALMVEGVLERDVGSKVRTFLELGLGCASAASSGVSKTVTSGAAVWWVLDFCCGSKSRCSAAKEEMIENWGIKVQYIGVDIAPVFWDGSRHIVPELVADVLDDVVFPYGECVRTIARRFNMCMDHLVHVFMSTPCATNSRADMSNRNRGCGYRDWRQAMCPPLPVGVKVDGVIPPGFTSQKHHDLAVLHDKLERKLIIGVAEEAECLNFSFSAENPKAGMARKAWMSRFAVAPLRTVEVHHCAFGGWYRKPTHYFTNLKLWRPRGWSGTGKCGKSGSQSVKRCTRGSMVEGRFKHFNTIARESCKEFSSGSVSRKMAKNALPALQTKEIVGAAWQEHGVCI